MSAVERSLGATPDAATMARQALDGLTVGLPARVREDARLLVSELVTNSVRHARLTPGQEIRFRATHDATLLRVEVSDPGHGFTLQPRTEDSPIDSGWGLYLVGEIADRWGISSDRGTSVWFELDIARAGDPGGRRGQGAGPHRGLERPEHGYRRHRPRREAGGGGRTWRCDSETNASRSAGAWRSPQHDGPTVGRAPAACARRKDAAPACPSTTGPRAAGSTSRRTGTCPSMVADDPRIRPLQKTRS
jgi:anti-sigma regulatory factor (Ser/Thr protein kinase)